MIHEKILLDGCAYWCGEVDYQRDRYAADQVVRIGWLRRPNDITLTKSRGTLEKALAERGIKVECAGPSLPRTRF